MLDTKKMQLSNADLQRYAPSVFAQKPSEIVSEHYSFIPTIDVIDHMRDAGWLPVHANQARGRTSERNATNRHMIRFRPVESELLDNGLCVESVLMNSHDRACSFVLCAGMLRFVCSNGIIVGDHVFGAMRLRHSSDAADEVLEASNNLIAQSSKMNAEVNLFNNIAMNKIQQMDYAKNAAEILNVNADPEQMLEPQRSEDERPSLWNTFNIIQEKAIHGGFKLNSPKRRTVTRGINEVRRNFEVNRKLWDLTAETANDYRTRTLETV